ncbi:MAG: FG-GAP-like repeat-containing protein [Candidatus Acidiferrales bacterium]
MLRAACEGNSWRPWLHRALCATLAALTVSLPVTPALGQQSAQPRTAFTNQPAEAPSAPNTTVPVDPKRAKQAYARGREAEKVGDWRGAYEAYAEAARELPEQREYVLRCDIARSRLVQDYVDHAERNAISGRMMQARADLSAAIALDPGDEVARERWNELSDADQTVKVKEDREVVPAGVMYLKPLQGTRDFDYRGDTRGAYEEVARQFGVHVAFDVDFGARPVHLRLTGLDFYTAMKVLGEMTGTFWRPLTPDLFFVAQDNAQKRKDYDASIQRTILLPSSSTPEDITEVLRVVRELTGITRTELDTRTRTITMRASPSSIALATELINDLEKPRGQLMLEVEVLEVNRDAAHNLGITPPQSSSLYTISKQEVAQAQSGLSGLVAVIEQVFGTPSSLNGLTNSQVAGLLGGGQLGLGTLIPPLLAFGGGSSTVLATIPGATANFAEALSLVHNGVHIRLRAEDGHPATYFVGNRVPVSLAQYSSSLTTADNVSGLSTSSFPTSDITTGNNPTFVTTATLPNTTTNDFIDVLVANNTDNTVSVFLGNGDGTFAAGTAYPTGIGPMSIATADFNGDGKLDVAVANQTDGTVSILLGNGDGTLGAKTDYPVGKSPVSVVEADFNGDGVPDLAVANQGDDTVSILLGNSTGTFQPAVAYATGAFPTALATGDFNGDGKIDLAVVNQNDDTVSILLGNGDGTFARQVTYPTGGGPVAIAEGDLNGDTFADLAVVNKDDDTVSVILGNGDGSFQPEVPYPTTSSPDSVAVADFNQDGRPDLAISEQGSDTVSVLLGLGLGTFAIPLDIPVGSSPSSVASADFNGDGLPDLAVANQSSNTATIILNSASAVAALATAAATGSTGTPYPGVEYLDLGVKLKATPRLHPNNEVSLQLSLEIRSLTGQSINQLPIISNRTIEQTVRLKEDETTILAGFLNSQETLSLNGWPGVAQVPGVGLLAGDQNTDRSGDEVMILITPHRINGAARLDREFYAGHEPKQGGGTLGPTLEEQRRPVEQQPAPPPEPEPQPLPQPEPQREQQLETQPLPPQLPQPSPPPQ